MKFYERASDESPMQEDTHLKSQTARVDRGVAKERKDNVERGAQEAQRESGEDKYFQGGYREERFRTWRSDLGCVYVCA